MQLKKWLSAFRLRTLPLSLSCAILGGTIAAYRGEHSWSISLLCLLTIALLQILSNLANDLGDSVAGTDNDQRLGPTRAVQSGSISPKAMQNAVILFSVLSLSSGIALLFVSFKNISSVFIGFLILGIIAIAAAIKYTIGKSAFGYKGLGDVFVFLFFGIVGVCGVVFLHTKSWHWDVLLPASSLGLLCTSVLNLNNMRDQENDSAHGKRTLVVKIGTANAKTYHHLLIGFGIILTIVFTIINWHSSYQLIFLVTLPVYLKNLKVVRTETDYKKLDPELKKVAIGTFVFSVCLGLGLLI